MTDNPEPAMETPRDAPRPVASGRISQLDLLRGFIMLVMAIDHVAYFVAKRHPLELWNVGLPEYPNFIAFFTRAITHLSAPGFFLLMGAGIALFHESRTGLGWSQRRIARYFVTRGLVLVLINQFLENPAWGVGTLTADPDAFWPVADAAVSEGMANIVVLTGVLTALGLSMVLAGLTSALPTVALVVTGLAAVIASQVLTPDVSQAEAQYSLFMRFLTVPGVTGFVYVLYSVLPWLGVTLCGMALGRRAGERPATIVPIGLTLGLVLLGMFVVMRANGGFGNHHPAPGSSLIDFLNVTKYPPSMTFLSLTLGINLILLGLLPRLPSAWRGVLDVYGRSPLFFYLAHIWLFTLIGLPFRQGTGYGVLYLVWVCGMIPLFFACTRFTAFKRAKPAESFWRML